MSENKENAEAKERTYSKLGFSLDETSEIVDKLNELLANYHLLYQKLRNFHWNVKGGNFFVLHEKFEEQYNAVKVNIDDIAERIRVFGATPLSNMTDYLSISKVKESKTDLDDITMVKTLLEDYETIVQVLNEVINTASNDNDSGTEDMAIAMTQEIEKTHWMFTSFVK